MESGGVMAQMGGGHRSSVHGGCHGLHGGAGDGGNGGTLARNWRGCTRVHRSEVNGHPIILTVK